ncbi:NAD(P)-binding protein [Auriscalpium vulgare]|uniref:NAD(P)-binding protein n=1 Tax=Auriscalpium vulgare TaxID=40419 RepID=A0ACB8RCQ7_9AGAM|nr:NAD(P)-binding protein [Auriscalpium vulgare]
MALTYIWPLAAALPIYLAYKRLVSRPSRPLRIPPAQERVLIIGASSGIGRVIAHTYSKRGARVCVVSRRQGELAAVHAECVAASASEERILSVVADCANAEDMIRVRDAVEKSWQGLDTVIMSAGVSALRPLLEVAEVEGSEKATAQGSQKAVDAALAAMQVNYVGPLLSAVTFIPLLSSTSPSPSILLISSLAAAIPAPTRSIYASSKAAALLLFQALAIEHPAVAFSYILPSTVQGAFRASAVDGGTVREANPQTHGLPVDAVAARCVRAVDAREKVVFYPAFYRWAQLLYWFWPSFVERKASQKYNFESSASQ